MKLSPIVLSCLALSLLTVTGARAQFPRIKVPKVPTNNVPVPSLEGLLKEPAPITSGLDDAVTEVSDLDNFEPTVVLPMMELPRTADNGFYLPPGPGVWEMTERSYCLHAGTHGPSQGDGHIYAPLKGPKAAIVRTILITSSRHPEIDQHDVQVLLWAIIARTKFSDMPRSYQATAARLLSPKELLDLNGGAMGVIAPEAREKAFANLPPAARQVFEAENELRAKLTSTVETPYDELERIAVPIGGITTVEPGGRMVKRGRWSYNPDGYFIRYFAEGYPTTRIQVYLPEKFEIRQDKRGHIERALIGDTLALPTVQIASAAPLTPSLLASAPTVIRFTMAGGSLKPFNPSGGLAMPPGNGQRLAQSPFGKGDKNRPNYDAVNNAARHFPKGPIVSIPNGGFLGMGATNLGFAIPRALFQYILDWNNTTWNNVNNALNGGDGGNGNGNNGGRGGRGGRGSLLPRSPYQVASLRPIGNGTFPSVVAADYRTVYRVQPVTWDTYTPDKGVTAAQAGVINDLVRTTTDVTLNLRAAALSWERQQAALNANDSEWAEKQARAVIYYKRAAGVAMVAAANAMDAYAKILASSNVTVSDASARAEQDRLRTKGFTPEELSVAHKIGLTDAEIDTYKQQRINANPSDMTGSVADKYTALAEALREAGTPLAAFPVLPEPQ